jgi:hypothetical protein
MVIKKQCLFVKILTDVYPDNEVKINLTHKGISIYHLLTYN